MFRYSIAVLALGAAAFAASPATARGGHQDGGYHRHHRYHHHRGYPALHRGWHGWHRFHRRPVFASCWRWTYTPLGYSKVWICR